MLRTVRNFLRKVEAQDLVEYTLLLGFIALLGISFVIGTGGSIQGIWGASNSTLVAANSTAGGGGPASSPGGGGSGGGGGGDGDHGGDHGGDGH